MLTTNYIDHASAQSPRSSEISTADKTNLKISYALHELLMQCNFDMSRSDEESEWLSFEAQGRELI